ncbi:MAG: NAD(P)-dependent oxidoreductase [Acidobacteriota bacterium]
MKIGFIGLGNMGLHLAGNILDGGFDLHVYNRTPSKAALLVARGAAMASSPAELTERVDIVLACLADVAASEDVFLGENGVVSAARPGQILVDHSTVDPVTSRRLHRAAEQKGAHFLDAPLSGGPESAEAGTLTIMVGGDEAALQRALPVFQAVGKTIAHMGGPGAGSATKLVNQALVGVHTLASCEAILLGMKWGLGSGRLTGVLMRSWGGQQDA